MCASRLPYCFGFNLWLDGNFFKPIYQFKYIKIQSQTIDLRTRLWGINPTNSVFIPQSLVLRSTVWGWILIYRNWSLLFSYNATSKQFNFTSQVRGACNTMNLIQTTSFEDITPVTRKADLLFMEKNRYKVSSFSCLFCWWQNLCNPGGGLLFTYYMTRKLITFCKIENFTLTLLRIGRS